MRARQFCSASFLALTVSCLPTWVAAAETPTSLQGVKVVTAEQVKDLMSKGAPVVDTRAANEFAEKSIKGAISIPYREKSGKEASFDASQDRFDLSKIPSPKTSAVVFFCNSGTCWKSYKAAVVARDAGFTQVHWFRGGMPEWDSKGLPTQ